MPARTPPIDLPAVVSVTEMAKRVGLSRSRFYDLIKAGIFPAPVYCVRTQRPMFVTEQQAEILRVRTSNIGVNGEFVLFYVVRDAANAATSQRRPNATRQTSTVPEANRSVVEGLRALGMASVTPQQVSDTLRYCYPEGWQGRDEGEVLRTCWQQLRRTGVA